MAGSQNSVLPGLSSVRNSSLSLLDAARAHQAAHLGKKPFQTKLSRSFSDTQQVPGGFRILKNRPKPIKTGIFRKLSAPPSRSMNLQTFSRSSLHWILQPTPLEAS
jgi:hypothetical protein